MPLLELRDITKDFPGVRALDGVSFTLEKGEIHALCGENGAGKSTLIKTLCGVNPYGTYGGEILIDGAPVRFQSLKDAEQHGIALIAQELALVPELSVEENLSLGREPVRAGLIRWDIVRERAKTALQMVGLDIDPARATKQLGIGQQQLVEIAKALSKKARILVLDEPTAALTESDAARLNRLLGELRSTGVSCIYISHRLEEVFQVADRITVLRDGRSVGGAPRAELTTDKVIAMMVGREVGTLYPRPPHLPGVPLLKVQDWTVEDPLVPGRHVLRNVSLEVREREIVGIGGLMGAGRTALVSSLFGAARSRVTGTLSLSGGPPRKPFPSPPEAIAAGLALVSEDRKRYGLVLDASVSENLTLASLRRFVRGLFVDDKSREVQAQQEADALRVRSPGWARPCASSPAATSRRSCSGSGCSPSRASSSSTSPLAAWTWGPRRRSTASSPSWRRRGWAWSSCPPTSRSCWA